MRQDQFAQVTPVGLGPRALAGVTAAVAPQEGLELRPAPAQVPFDCAQGLRLHGVGPRPAAVAHGLVAGVGHMHRRQFARPVPFGFAQGLRQPGQVAAALRRRPSGKGSALWLSRSARLSASRRSVLIRSPERVGISDGATTTQAVFNCPSRRARTKPVGPALTAAAAAALRAEAPPSVCLAPLGCSRPAVPRRDGLS